MEIPNGEELQQTAINHSCDIDFKDFTSCTDRSSHQRCSMKKGALRNFAKFAGKHLC